MTNEEIGGFLATVSDAERQAILGSGTRRRLPSGTFLFTEGSRSDQVFVILSGRVKVSSFGADGREVVLALRGPGDLIGEFSVLDGDPRSASVAAVEDAEVVTVSADRFRDLLEEHPGISVRLLEGVIAKLRDAERQRVEYGTHDTTERVASRLVELAERYGSDRGADVEIDLPITQEELAGWTGASREAVSRALRTLRERGWIETHRRRIVVLDLERLRSKARA